MKWFTRACLTGGLSDDDWQSHYDGYSSHLDRLTPKLCRGAEGLHPESLNMMHAIPRDWGYDDQEFWMQLIIGDLEVGYERVLVEYHDAVLIPDTALEDFARWPLTRREIGQDVPVWPGPGFSSAWSSRSRR